MKRDSVSAYEHMTCDTFSHCMQLYVFWMTLPHYILPPVAYVLNSWPLFQLKTHKDIRISYSLKYKHSKKLNGNVGWNKHSGEQH